MYRRHFIAGLAGIGLGGCRIWPEQGLLNPCLPPQLPEPLRSHESVQSVFEGLRADYLWDSHVHLIGNGDSGSGIWTNPDMQSLFHPLQFAQFRFYLNASCASKKAVDESFLSRLISLKKAFPPGSRLMLLAFDYTYDESGRRRRDLSAFHTPNELAAEWRRQYPRQFEWIASIHPYRNDALEALETAIKAQARGIKWLPPAMGMDPGSPLCDPFYEAMAETGIVLLVHGGEERAVHGSGKQEYGNPLLLRRPLEHGVRVVIAHCASLGKARDLDKGKNGPWTDSFSLFKRLMNEPRFHNNLFGEISAVTQSNRDLWILKELIETGDWQERLVNGSDYPLPGVMPLFSLQRLRGFITESEIQVLSEVRRHNALLFDFMLKRLLRSGGKGFGASVFESRRVYGPDQATRN